MKTKLNKKQKKNEIKIFFKVWVVILIMHFHEKLKRTRKASDPAPPSCPPEVPLLPRQGRVTHHLSLEPANPLHTLDSRQPGFSRAIWDSRHVIPGSNPGTVVYSGKNLPVVFGLLGSLCWGRGKICEGFGGTAPSCPTCSLCSQGEAAACPQSTPSPDPEFRGLTVHPGALESEAAWRSRAEDPGTSKTFIHREQLLWRNQSRTRVNHAELSNPAKFECKIKLNRLISWTGFVVEVVEVVKQKEGRSKKELYFSHLLFYTEIFLANG